MAAECVSVGCRLTRFSGFNKCDSYRECEYGRTRKIAEVGMVVDKTVSEIFLGRAIPLCRNETLLGIIQKDSAFPGIRHIK